METKGKKIILGSNSPRRRELLKGLDIEFIVDPKTDFIESFSSDTPYEKVPALMSEGKSKGFHRELKEDEILITADTMVLCDQEILGKPRSKEEAVSMLKMLSGCKHHVITAVTLRDRFRIKTFSDTSNVWFKELTDREIEYYLDIYKPYDKAGSYGVQEWIGYIGIDRIEGSYFNIMGFPTHLVYRELLDLIE